MAKAEYIKALIKAHVINDNNKFRQIALQIAAKEASAGHARYATEIRELIDQVTPILGQQAGRIPPNIRTTVSNMTELLQAYYPNDKLEDMVLSEDTKLNIDRAISEWRSHQLLESYGLCRRTKLLIVGPPGCGKTMSARVFAGELELPLFIVKLEGLISRYLGETSVHINSIFNAMNTTPGVYLFDEFDSIGTTRGDQRDVGEIRRVLSTFLMLLENFNGNSLIIAATNYDHVLDMALFRRFDDVIKFPLPDQKNALALIKLKLKNFPCGRIHWGVVAKETFGMSYGEITKAVTEAIKTSVLQKSEMLQEDILIEAIKHRGQMNPSTEKQ